ncbi:DUF2786 domain-containing protein [Cryptosporangium aurantiacum]|uniref:DUF2786 domain-containing protein n=1 Tax=Cryptosporangium aurantiacum TaxID=134849 RepID=A0A1M7Q4Z6_9ACTN|nr:DUF2786 domain-containing protein [Cryptosporangium aurantiacum]SHN25347.1 Protein of unknown function [Cryptosporangium aurantiacum]
MSASEAKLATIRKLLAQAEDAAASPAEAETFTAKAAELMARYGVDRAMLADGDETVDAIADRVIDLDPPYALDKIGLLSGIARALGLQVVQRTGFGARGKELSALLFGYSSDIERTEILFTSLLVQAARGLAAARVPARENKAAYRRAWLAGFSATVHVRLADAEYRARAEATATASTSATGRSAELVLADRQRTVDQRFAEAFPKLRSAPRRVLTGSGHGAGVAAGARADLGGAALGSRRRALGG